MYFKSVSLQYAFYLLELDGQCRLDKLGVTRNMYCSKVAAKNWLDKVMGLIGEVDVELKDRAVEKLEEIYNGMVA